MYAAFKGTVLDAVLYVGIAFGEKYPEWFEDEIIGAELNYVDRFDILHLNFMTGVYDTFKHTALVPGESVIIRNRYNDYMHACIDEIEALYTYIGPHRIALTSDCVEYFVFTQRTLEKNPPDWILDLIKRRFITLSRGFKENRFYSETGEYAMSPMCVFIKNHEGGVRYLEPNEFERYFDANYPYNTF